jgi:hypothetical protein
MVEIYRTRLMRQKHYFLMGPHEPGMAEVSAFRVFGWNSIISFGPAG